MMHRIVGGMLLVLAWPALASSLAREPITTSGQEQNAQPNRGAPGASAVHSPGDKAAESGINVNDISKWPMDRLILNDGSLHAGRIRSVNEREIDLLEIVRLPGKPLNMLGRKFPRSEVKSVERLEETDRALLQRLIDQHSTRGVQADLDKKRLEIVVRKDPRGVWRSFRGSGFSLEGNIDDDVARTAIVRIDQRLRAYRQYLPQRIEPRRPLTIVLFATPREYQAYLVEQGLKVNNAALYAADTNQVIAYSDLGAVAEKCAKAVDRHRLLVQELHQKKLDLRKNQERESKELKAKGASKDEITSFLRLWNAKFAAEVEAIERSIEERTRHNSRLLDEVTDQVYRTLYHEAFHAYLENYVYEDASRHVPRWLNEGLAQVFEGGLIESDKLRIDAPDREKLARLQADLAGADSLAVRDVLLARPESFLGIHGQSGAEAQRYYLYSWGLVHYLTFEKRVLGTQAFDAYVSADRPRTLPIDQFQALLGGVPLSQFEAQWRTYILRLSDRKPGVTGSEGATR